MRCTLAVCGARCLMLLLAGEVAPAAAHPHVWITDVTTFVFEGRQLVGLRHRWTFDEFFGSFVIEEHDLDGDGRFDPAETAALREAAFDNLEEFDYFTHLRIDGDAWRLREIEAFRATIEDGVLIYEFTLSLPRAGRPRSRRSCGRRLRSRILCRAAARRARSGALRGPAGRRLHLRHPRGHRAPDLLRHGLSTGDHARLRDQLTCSGPLRAALLALVLLGRRRPDGGAGEPVREPAERQLAHRRRGAARAGPARDRSGGRC